MEIDHCCTLQGIGYCFTTLLIIAADYVLGPVLSTEHSLITYSSSPPYGNRFHYYPILQVRKLSLREFNIQNDTASKWYHLHVRPSCLMTEPIL